MSDNERKLHEVIVYFMATCQEAEMVGNRISNLTAGYNGQVILGEADDVKQGDLRREPKRTD